MDRIPDSTDDVSALIGKLLKSQDPATVGLRRIIKEKEDRGKAFPVDTYSFEEFNSPRTKSRLFTENERQVLELEKQVVDLKKELDSIKNKAAAAEKAAFERGQLMGLGKGGEDGYARAKKEFDARTLKMQDEVGAFLQSVETAQKDIFSNGVHLLLRLTFELIQKIIQVEVSTNREIVLNVLKKSLTFISDRERLVVRVSRGDLETITGNQDFWLPVAQRLTSISIEPDDRIDAGGCIIESNSGVADARLGVQFEALKDLIEKIWESLLDTHSQHAAHTAVDTYTLNAVQQ